MRFIKFNYESCTDKDFISFWSQFYDEGKYPDSIYEQNLNRDGALQEENVEPLLEWKNARPLSSAKKQIVLKINKNLVKFNDFRQLSKVSDRDFQMFWNLVSGIIRTGFVWKIFLFHIARPDDYPIVDQHVLRSWNFLRKGKVDEPEMNLQNYWDYRDFFLHLVEESTKTLRDTDRALMAFGQFLKSQFFKENTVKVSQ